MSNEVSEDVTSMKAHLNSLMKIVYLQQDFNSQQEKQNAKINKRLAELEKNAGLFKAFTSHDGVLAQIKGVGTQIEEMQAAIDDENSRLSARVAALEDIIENKMQTTSQSVLKLNERINLLQYGINTQNRIKFAESMGRNRRDTSSDGSPPPKKVPRAKTD